MLIQCLPTATGHQTATPARTLPGSHAARKTGPRKPAILFTTASRDSTSVPMRFRSRKARAGPSYSFSTMSIQITEARINALTGSLRGTDSEMLNT